MQNNNLFNRMYDEIQKAHYILLVTHKNPDADTISSALALSNYFYENKIKHKTFNISSLPRKLNFLSKFDKISQEIPKYYDLVIYLDCANQFRVGYEFSNEIKSISIDHHKSNTNFANINILDYSKGSTSELLYSFFKINKLILSKNIAECLYVGIYEDSSAFTSPRTNHETFEVVSDLLNSNINVSKIANSLLKREALSTFRILPQIMNTLELFNEGKIATIYLDDRWVKETGANISECDEIVNTVLNIGIVQVVAYFRVIENQVRVSLRSKDSIDVSLIAARLNGGGHKNSAGISVLTSSITEAKEKVVNTILNYISY